MRAIIDSRLGYEVSAICCSATSAAQRCRFSSTKEQQRCTSVAVSLIRPRTSRFLSHSSELRTSSIYGRLIRNSWKVLHGKCDKWIENKRRLHCQASSSVPVAPVPSLSDPDSSQLRAVTSPTVSIIIPVYNEVGSISILVKKITAVMKKRGGLFEIICIDDGSTDGSSRVLKGLAGELEHVRAVLLRRNFGQTAAMAAGFDFAAGDIVVSLDGDLQNDPDDIPRLLDVLISGPQSGEVLQSWGTPGQRDDGGYDMVCGWRKSRKDNALTRNFPSHVANWLIGQVTGVKLHDYGCSLKAFRTPLVHLLRLYGEMHRFLPALAAMEGASIAEVEVRHNPRTSGRSKYGLSRIPRVLLDLLTVFFLANFRDRPLHFIGILGGICLLSSGAFAASFCFSFHSTWRAYGSMASAWTCSLSHLVAALEMLILGAQVFCMGLVADLCMRTYFESQDRRIYRVREVVPAV